MAQQSFFFVDESGDSTFFDKRGNQIVGKKGCSPILILGFITTNNPQILRAQLRRLHQQIEIDEYLKDIPSITKTNKFFHAKDDCPEVREKVFKLLKKLDFKAQFIVARKNTDIFIKRHKRSETTFYTEIVARLFERSLHKNHNIIYFSKRGSQTKQHHLQGSIQTAILNFEQKTNRKIETSTKVIIQTPSDEPCLQIVDYLNWMVYRAYTKNEMRYYTYLQEKVSFLCDIYDFKKYPDNFYSKTNKFNTKKISPLALVP
jgi:hypothetical protein